MAMQVKEPTPTNSLLRSRDDGATQQDCEGTIYKIVSSSPNVMEEIVPVVTGMVTVLSEPAVRHL